MNPPGRPRDQVHLRRYLWILGVAIVLLVGAAALASMQAGRSVGQVSVDTCSPKPCAAPSGFGAYFSGVVVADGVVHMNVSFINHPHQQVLVDYNHTSPADFQLRHADGSQTKPVFNAECADWGELKVRIGDSAGPVPLCFGAHALGTQGTFVIWGPDLGLTFDDVQVPLS